MSRHETYRSPLRPVNVPQSSCSCPNNTLITENNQCYRILLTQKQPNTFKTAGPDRGTHIRQPYIFTSAQQWTIKESHNK